ncbi:hypothetical protein FXO38_24096 [Capsicum annuum]|nr:hypothetical protein FXO38_24096 [Capsicum annuum]
MYNFGDIGDSSTSSAADHIAATLSLPSPQPFSQHGTDFFECGLKFATLAAIMKPFFFLRERFFNDYKQAFLDGKSISEAFHLVPEVVERVLINEAGAKRKMPQGP